MQKKPGYGFVVKPGYALLASVLTVALVMDDPDAPREEPFIHWVFWNLPSTTSSLAEGADIEALGGVDGSNGAGETGYIGPCPPSGTHRYFFKVYALSETLALAQGAKRDALDAAMQAKILAWGELMGTFTR